MVRETPLLVRRTTTDGTQVAFQELVLCYPLAPHAAGGKSVEEKRHVVHVLITAVRIKLFAHEELLSCF